MLSFAVALGAEHGGRIDAGAVAAYLATLAVYAGGGALL